MKRTTKAALSLGAIGGGAAGLLVWLTAPGRAPREWKEPFMNRNFAHRGLYDPALGIPENSMAAFRAAARAGYGVELDARLTRDGQVVVSHDDDLRRMTGQAGEVHRLTWPELQEYRLGGTGESIPLLSQALDVLGAGRVPVILEVKPCRRRRELCEKVLALLDGHSGSICVESFDPLIVRWFRRHAPDILRGQLTSQASDLGASPLAGFALSRLLTNFLCRPHFIAHHIGRRSFPVWLCRRMGAMQVCWTAQDRSWEKKNDAVIFEHCTPPVRYR